SSGPLLVDVAAALAEDAESPLYVLHLERPPERGMLGVGVAAASNSTALAPTLAHASARGLGVRPLQFLSRSPADDIRAVARAKGVPAMRVIASRSPIDTVIREAAAHDLTVLGVGEGWQLEPHVFGLRSERLAADCPSSLLVVRGRSDAAS